MLIPTLFLLGLGFSAAVILSIASKVFYVWEDPKVIEIEESLLGANCGGCGFPGCHAAAVSIAEGKSGADTCVAGGPDITQAVAAILGVEIELKEPEISTLTCRYNVSEADKKFDYSGVADCRAAMLFAGGSKECPVGCLGLGTCVRACPFGAIEMGKDGLPVILKDKCRACGICIEICPKNILHLSSTSERMIGENITEECTTPCQRTCPTGIDIQAYIKQINLGNYGEAIRIIREKNPLPLTCGRICPAPCELECRRNLVDEPVAINYLKRFAADYEMKSGSRVHPYISPYKTNKKVAVVGGGAQGLTTSYYLGCLGHDVTIFEASDKLGGILRDVIVRSRLPEDVIEWEIGGILDIGVKTEINKIIGKDVSVNSLLFDKDYEAVALASGGLESRRIIRGTTNSENIISGLYTLLDFYIISKNNGDVKTGDKVYIFGGGNASLEIANICRQKGSKEINIIYPFSSEEFSTRGFDISGEQYKGINFIFSTAINLIRGQGENLNSIGLNNLISGDREEKQADTLIVATGSFSDIVIVKDNNNNNEEDETRNTWRSLETFKLFPESNGDLFGTAVTSRANDNLAVVKAIGRGRKIARAAHQYLTGKEISIQENTIIDKSSIINIDHVSNVTKKPRQDMPVSDRVIELSESDKQYDPIEINIGFSEEIAKKEAERCLECGLICYKKIM